MSKVKSRFLQESNFYKKLTCYYLRSSQDGPPSERVHEKEAGKVTGKLHEGRGRHAHERVRGEAARVEPEAVVAEGGAHPVVGHDDEPQAEGPAPQEGQEAGGGGGGGGGGGLLVRGPGLLDEEAGRQGGPVGLGHPPDDPPGLAVPAGGQEPPDALGQPDEVEEEQDEGGADGELEPPPVPDKVAAQDHEQLPEGERKLHGAPAFRPRVGQGSLMFNPLMPKRYFPPPYNPARQNDGDFGRNSAYFPLIFSRFSAYGTPSFLYTQAWYPICHFTTLMFTDSAYFLPIFTHFLPIFCLNGTPSLLYTQAWYPIRHFSAHMFTDSVYFSLLLRSSCLAGNW